jgi:tryptophan halogenase
MTKKRLAVVGVGTAGIQALCHYLSWLDETWTVVSIHDPLTTIFGIGESSNPSFIAALETGVNFNFLYDIEKVNGTLKLGTVYKQWRDSEFINPLLSGSLALHFDSEKLRSFILPRLVTKWEDKFEIIEGNVSAVHQTSERVILAVGQTLHTFDYVMDCTGFPADYSNYTVLDDFTVNHALVHNVKKQGDWQYTGHHATPDGWMFEIPLTNRQSYGYMFNDNITNIDDARKNFSDILEVPVSELDNIEYKFKTFYANQVLDGRIIKNGNSAIFFEPLFANSIFNYDQINKSFFDYITGNITAEDVEFRFQLLAEQVRDMIAYHYIGGSTYDTKFWKVTAEKTKPIVENSRSFNFFKDSLSNITKNKSYQYRTGDAWCFDEPALLMLDKNFQYNFYVDTDKHFIL